MWIPRLLGAAFAALILVSPALAKPPVWIARDADSEMVIFGSVHVLPEGLDWEPEALVSALARTDDLWFELPMDPGSEIEIARIAASKGVLPPDKSLYDLLSPKAKARLTKAAIRFHMASSLAAGGRPRHLNAGRRGRRRWSDRPGPRGRWSPCSPD